MSEGKRLCAFCNKPAAKYIMPRPINGKTFDYIPVCGTDCRTKRTVKQKK